MTVRRLELPHVQPASTDVRTGKPTWLRHVYTSAGVMLTGVGIAGVILPVLPGTIFLILALWCFQRGNAKWEAWLIGHPRFGATLREWDATKSLRPRTKAIVATVIVLFSLGSARSFAADTPWAAWAVAAVGVAGVAYVLSRPTLLDSR